MPLSNDDFDLEMLIIARSYTEKALIQSITSFNFCKDKQRKAFWWDGFLKKTKEMNEINIAIREQEAAAEMKQADRLKKLGLKQC